MNVEHRTFNIECLMKDDIEAEIGVPGSAIKSSFSFEVGRSMFDVHFVQKRETLSDDRFP
jgi:hypothetical protein